VAAKRLAVERHLSVVDAYRILPPGQPRLFVGAFSLPK
jgi:hypothetical protein